MTVQTLYPDYPSEADFRRAVAQTVNAILRRWPLEAPPGSLASYVPVVTYYDPAVGGLVFWSGTEWRWVATAEVAP